MSITVSGLLLPTYRRMLNNLRSFLEKAEANAAARNFDVAVLLQARLSPDMFPLVRQVQIACDHAKNGASRVAGLEPPRFEDNETTVAQLKDRIQKTLAHLDTVPVSALDGGWERDVTFPSRGGPRTMKGDVFIHGYNLPNFYFHVTAAYAILRHNGVDLGKADFIGPA